MKPPLLLTTPESCMTNIDDNEYSQVVRDERAPVFCSSQPRRTFISSTCSCRHWQASSARMRNTCDERSLRGIQCSCILITIASLVQRREFKTILKFSGSASSTKTPMSITHHVTLKLRLLNKKVHTQDAQLSQRDRAAGCVTFGQKWKTATGRQYFTDIIGLSSATVT